MALSGERGGGEKSTDADVEHVDVDIDFTVTEYPAEDLNNVYNPALRNNLPGTDGVYELEDQLNQDWNQVPITKVEVVRPAGMGGAQATLKAYLEETSALKYATSPYTTVEVKIKVNGEWVFTGTVLRVTQNEQGIVTFDAMDARRQLHNHTVQLDLRENGTPSKAVIENLLVTDGPFTENEVHVYFPDGGVTIDVAYGDTRRVSIREVLKDILSRNHAFAYVSRRNNIIVQPIPPVQELTSKQVLSFNAGDTKGGNTTVLAESPQADSQLNFFGSHYTSGGVTRGKAGKGANDGRTKLIKDNVSKSVEESTNKAVDAQFRQDFINNVGRVQVAGDNRITPFDQYVLEDLPEYAEMASDTYTVQEVTHTLSPTDGFVTDVKLTTDLRTLWNKIYDTQDIAKERKGLIEKIADGPLIGPGLGSGLNAVPFQNLSGFVTGAVLPGGSDE